MHEAGKFEDPLPNWPFWVRSARCTGASPALLASQPTDSYDAASDLKPPTSLYHNGVKRAEVSAIFVQPRKVPKSLPTSKTC